MLSISHFDFQLPQCEHLLGCALFSSRQSTHEFSDTPDVLSEGEITHDSRRHETKRLHLLNGNKKQKDLISPD